MAKKIAQIQFTQQQLEQLEELKRQTGLNRTKFVRRAEGFYKLPIGEHG
ncbi:MAG: ribbon-helix-helix protein, CopG family [Caldilineaceae bacterium SB0664_bin_27]|uniref:Ribbon-helix-helix protein, CopG family n=1 Tax=Caldilineaceae bacterium SB0664_bin_27 TaxID=2605260 RepID=A0A6B0YRP7_9CHLR|nr:ribbon-helix-helix protein, CopG family [Caldilineaceae bacterium SB0664_bin_27]